MDPSTLKTILQTTTTATITSVKNAAPQLYTYAQANPKRTAVAGASLIALPFGGTTAVAGWILKCVGFGSAGPIGGMCIDQI